MAKKYRRQKLKRYRRSYYSPGMRVRRTVSIAVLVLVVLAAAWFAAPHVLDWATHTWYTVVRDRDLEAESASAASAAAAASSRAAAEAAASSERAASSKKEAKTAQAVPEQTGAKVVAGSWAYIERAALTDEAAVTAAAKQAATQGAKYALVTLKDSAGTVYYASSVAALSGSMAAQDELVDPKLIASVFKANGLIPVAQAAAFRDPVTPYNDRSIAIHYRSSGGEQYLWLDAANAAAGGKPWVNPYSTAAVEYVGDMIAELHEAGFDHVVLSCVQFPSAVSSKQDFGSTGGVSRSAQLAADIAAWHTRFGSAVTLWYRYSLSDCTGSASSLGGTALELGMQNLLIEVPEKNTLDEAGRAQLLQAAADAGVTHTVIRDDTAGYFE